MTNGTGAWIAIGSFGLGLSAGLLLLLVASRGALQFLASLNPWVARGAVASIAVASITMLLIPDKNESPAAPPSASAATVMTSPGTPGSAGSMETATQVLAARLAAQGGSDADWNLLAESYDFLGRADAARLAREHKVSTQRSLQDSMAASAPVRPAGSMPAMMPQPSMAGGGTADLLAQAEVHRRKREFKQACEVYRRIIATGAMTADSWADYADALASSAPGGSLSGEPAKAIDKALALDPKQTKALWLKASLAHEERRYQDALTAWRALLALMPAGSSDARIIEANIAEDQRLARQKG